MKKITLFIFLILSCGFLSAGQFDSSSGGGNAGDITTVGDCTTGDCFSGSSGTILTFNNGTADSTLGLNLNSTDDNIGMHLRFPESDGTEIPILLISDASYTVGNDFNNLTESGIWIIGDSGNDDDWLFIGTIATGEYGMQVRQNGMGFRGGTLASNVSIMKVGAASGVIVNDDSNSAIDFRWESDGDANGIFGDASANAVGFFNGAPTQPIDLIAADNTTSALKILINAAQASVTAADVFIGFYSTTGLEGSVAGTATGGLIAYNTFLGAHYANVEGQIPVLGQIVEMTGNVMPEANPHLPTVRLSKTKASKAVYGVFAGKIADASSEKELQEIKDIEARLKAIPSKQAIYDFSLKVESAIGMDTSKTQAKKALLEQEKNALEARLKELKTHSMADYAKGDKGKDLYQVFGSGAGIVTVSDANGNIEVGDLLESDGNGFAQKQSDDVIRSSTIGKATVSVDWSNEDKKTKLIGAMLYAG